VNEEIKKRISEIDFSIIPTGYGNTLGNKGGIIFKFNVDCTSFVIMCCHCSSGKSKTKDRIKDLKVIHSKAF